MQRKKASQTDEACRRYATLVSMGESDSNAVSWRCRVPAPDLLRNPASFTTEQMFIYYSNEAGRVKPLYFTIVDLMKIKG